MEICKTVNGKRCMQNYTFEKLSRKKGRKSYAKSRKKEISVMNAKKNLNGNYC